jgi:hypothetical protein
MLIIVTRYINKCKRLDAVARRSSPRAQGPHARFRIAARLLTDATAAAVPYGRKSECRADFVPRAIARMQTKDC